MLYNGIYIPYHVRLTGTTPEESDHTGREAERWGTKRVTHPEEREFHLLTREEREKDD